MSVAKIVGLTALGVAGLAWSGCSSDSRENEPRPPIPTGVSVHLTDERVSLSPLRIGFEAETHQHVIVDERQDEIQAPSDEPLPVRLTIANTTPRATRIELVGPARRISPKVTATGTVLMSTRLPTGVYQVRVADRDVAGARLVVGPDRSSPQNDLLLP